VQRLVYLSRKGVKTSLQQSGDIRGLKSPEDLMKALSDLPRMLLSPANSAQMREAVSELGRTLARLYARVKPAVVETVKDKGEHEKEQERERPIAATGQATEGDQESGPAEPQTMGSGETTASLPHGTTSESQTLVPGEFAPSASAAPSALDELVTESQRGDIIEAVPPVTPVQAKGRSRPQSKPSSKPAAWPSRSGMDLPPAPGQAGGPKLPRRSMQPYDTSRSGSDRQPARTQTSSDRSTSMRFPEHIPSASQSDPGEQKQSELHERVVRAVRVAASESRVEAHPLAQQTAACLHALLKTEKLRTLATGVYDAVSRAISTNVQQVSVETESFEEASGHFKVRLAFIYVNHSSS
jgi:hypothetical protein